MYLDFYQLKHAPFPSTPEPAHLFLSPSHQQAITAITSGVEERHGFVLITGAGGVGKTMILRAYLAQEHPAQLTTLVIANPQVTFPALLTTLCQACGLETTGLDRFAMQTELQQYLLAAYRQGRNVAVLIDDAHRMPLTTLEQLWLLANLDIAAPKLIQIVLFGEPELEQRFHRYALRHIAQRIAIRATIVPLTKAESHAYIRQGLARAAMPGRPVFTRGALTCLVRAAHGVPGRLTSLCTQALVTGCRMRQRPITTRLARAVVRAEGPGAPPTPRWLLGLATAAGILLATGGIWLTLRGPLQPAPGPESPPPLAPAGAQLPQPAQEPLTVSPSLQPSLDNTAVPTHDTHAEPTPLPSAGPAPIPSSPATDEVNREAAPTPDVGETPSPPAATPAGEPQPAPDTRTTETQALPPGKEDTTSAHLPRTVVIKRGDSVWKLALETYGFVDAALLQRIHEHNPQLKNLDVIPLDAKLVLPELTQQRTRGQ